MNPFNPAKPERIHETEGPGAGGRARGDVGSAWDLAPVGLLVSPGELPKP